jgi:type I restriction enzyme, R subunit
VIVLDRRIGSMTEFKQIIGRGTRIREDYGKQFFTIIDFRKATELFADPDWDGPPLDIYNPGEGDPVTPSDGDDGEVPVPEPDEEPGVKKYIVGGQPFEIAAERVQYYDRDGQLTIESLRDYTKRTVAEEFTSLDDFLRRWQEADRKQAIVSELREHGVLLEALAEMVGPDYDPFDLVCHVAYDQPPLTRQERAENVRKRDVFAKYGDVAQKVLDGLLAKYADQGLEQIEELAVLQLSPLSGLGTPVELVRAFGGKQLYLDAVQELESALYSEQVA